MPGIVKVRGVLVTGFVAAATAAADDADLFFSYIFSMLGSSCMASAKSCKEGVSTLAHRLVLAVP